MPGGRPPTYGDEILAQARAYLVDYAELGDPVPTLEGLADELGIGRTTLYRWKQEHEEFRHILDKIMSRQGRKLVSGGLNGIFNHAITKMMMTKHGYSDKTELDHSSSDGSMKPVHIILEGVSADEDTDTQ